MDFGYIHLNQSAPEHVHVRRHVSDEKVQLWYVKAFYQLAFWQLLHNHYVLKDDPARLEEHKL
jgi:hypothetical protein